MKLETNIQTRTKFPNIYEELKGDFKKPIKSEIFNDIDFIEDQLKSEIHSHRTHITVSRTKMQDRW